MDTIEPTADTVEQARCHCGHGVDDHWYSLFLGVESAPQGCVRPACGCNTYRPPR